MNKLYDQQFPLSVPELAKLQRADPLDCDGSHYCQRSKLPRCSLSGYKHPQPGEKPEFIALIFLGNVKTLIATF